MERGLVGDGNVDGFARCKYLAHSNGALYYLSLLRKVYTSQEPTFGLLPGGSRYLAMIECTFSFPVIQDKEVNIFNLTARSVFAHCHSCAVAVMTVTRACRCPIHTSPYSPINPANTNSVTIGYLIETRYASNQVDKATRTIFTMANATGSMAKAVAMNGFNSVAKLGNTSNRVANRSRRFKISSAAAHLLIHLINLIHAA